MFNSAKRKTIRLLHLNRFISKFVRTKLLSGACGRTRTGMLLPAVDFESTSSTNSNTPAGMFAVDSEQRNVLYHICKKKSILLFCFFSPSHAQSRKNNEKNALIKPKHFKKAFQTPRRYNLLVIKQKREAFKNERKQ